MSDTILYPYKGLHGEIMRLLRVSTLKPLTRFVGFIAKTSDLVTETTATDVRV